MKSAPLWFVALMTAFVPVVNDVCDLGCDLHAVQATTADADPVCPLHPRGGTTPTSKAPVQDRCGHDHTVGRAGLLRAVVTAPRPVVMALIVSPRMAVDLLRSSAASPTVLPHSPPIRAARPEVLRI